MKSRRSRILRHMRTHDWLLCLDQSGTDLLLSNGFMAMREPASDGPLGMFTRDELARLPEIDDEFCVSIHGSRPDYAVEKMRQWFDPSMASIPVYRVPQRVVSDRHEIALFTAEQLDGPLTVDWGQLRYLWDSSQEREPLWRYRPDEKQLIVCRGGQIDGIVMRLMLDPTITFRELAAAISMKEATDAPR